MAEPFLAEIRLMSFNFPPKGWALCNGQLLPINQNQGLFSLLGTTYGGDGRVNFGLPDLRGRVPIGVGNGHTLGERAGSESVTITATTMPQHTHLFASNNSTTGRNSSPNNRLPTNGAPNNVYGPAGDLVAMNPGNISNTGGSQAHLNLQPFLVISFCIALQGIFPSQN